MSDENAGTVAGVRLLRASLDGSGKPLLRIIAWSGLEAGPALAAGWTTATALDKGFLAGRPLTGLAWLGLLAVLYVARAVAERAMFPHLAEIVEPLRDKLVRRLVTATVADAVDRARPGDATGVSRLTGQVESVRSLVGTLLRTARPFTVTLVAAAVGLTALSPAASILVLPPLALAVAGFLLALRVMVRRRRALVLADEGFLARTGAVLTASRDIAAMGAEQYATGTVADAGTVFARARVRLSTVDSLRTLTVLIGGYAPVLLLIVFGSATVDGGSLTTGAVVGTVTYVVGQMLPALRALTGVLGAYWAQLNAVLVRLAQVSARPLTEPVDGARATIAGHELVVDGLDFRYGPAADPVLCNLSLRVPAGDHLVIVGASGIGKSTLANLLAGLERPDAGSVRLGGVPIEAFDDRVRAGLVVLVPQEAYVFPGTVRENLCYLQPWVEQPELERAIDLFGLTDVVERLGGYDGEIEDPATELSSGEGQLLVLVRAYVSGAAVVILDEASSHLDPVAEARAERAFAARSGTLIVIAHRIASAQRAKHILLLDGTGTAHGTHQELLVTSKGYGDLVGHWVA